MTLRVHFSSTSGEVVQTFAEAVFDTLIDDIDVRADVAPSQWTSLSHTFIARQGAPEGSTQFFMGKAGNGQGGVTFNHSANGITIVSTQSSHNSYAPATRMQVRVTMDAVNGTNRVYRFYERDHTLGLKLPSNTSWTELSVDTVAGTTSLASVNQFMEGGAVTNASILSGDIYELCVMSAINGSVIWNPDFTDETAYNSDYTGLTEASAGGLEVTLSNVTVLGLSAGITDPFIEPFSSSDEWADVWTVRPPLVEE